MANNCCNLKLEDTIYCSFFPTAATKLDDLCNALNKTIADLSKDYIWHKDEFKICVPMIDAEKKDYPAHLSSTTCFGDNIEDEWFIVYLVLQISSQYCDLVVQIEDNDGDFLLIEAAEFLPSWANPDTTKNRVFICQNNIHIIPPEVVSLDSTLDLQDAINLVVRKSNETKSTTAIQEAALKRIHSYPQKIRESHHKAFVTLPIDIATLLTLKPSLISPIVTLFCNHDMLDAKSFKYIEFDNCITVPILFTKYLYAMLVQSKLPKIPKCTSNSPKNKDVALGIKLSCGYQILMGKSSNDIFTTSEYNDFINRLSKSGYFRDNIKGSKHYNELLEKAKDYFSNTECPMSYYHCYNISNIKATEEFKNLKGALANRDSMDQTVVDSDEWLNINPDELNTFLNTHYGKSVVEGDASSNAQITSNLTHFLKKTSDFEGIEYVKEEETDTNNIDFDADQFVKDVEKMLSLVAGNNVDGDDMEDYFSEDDEILDMEEKIGKELNTNLNNFKINNSEDEIVKNLLQSINEEGISGPSSNILKNMDISKIVTLDSDDD